MLIDGHALAYRQFFALPAAGFMTKAGEPTNATFGFARTLLDILDERPNYLAVTFDQGPSGRGEMYLTTRARGRRCPTTCAPSFNRIREVVAAFNIPILELDGYEADDVLGSVAPQAEADDVDVLIITGDRDLLQLITERTTVQLPAGRSQGHPQHYDLARFREEYGLEPPQLVEIKGLMGDSSDNIPGVKGVGEKTAIKLIAEYGSVENLYEHLDAIKGALQTKLAEGRDSALLSRELARIRRDVPVTLDLNACVSHDYNYADVERLFRTLEFRSLIDRVPGKPSGSVSPQQMSMFEMAEAVRAPDQAVVPFVIVDDEAKLAALVETLDGAAAITWDVETTSTDQMRAELVGIALAVSGEEGYYVPVGHVAGNAPARPNEEAQPDLVAGHSPRQLPLETVIEALRPALTNPKIPKYAHNASYDLVVTRRYGST